MRKMGARAQSAWTKWKSREGSGAMMGKPLPENWQNRLLEYLEIHGTFIKACKKAGVSTMTVARYRAFDPEFDRACLEARLHAAENYEEEIIEQAKETGNPVGYIVRLKQLKPAEYIERHAVHSINVNVSTSLDEAAAVELLKAMIAETSEESRALLATPIPRRMLPEPEPEEVAAGEGEGADGSADE